MLFLKQSTASQSVLLGPFVDDTDGATAATGLSIANTDIRLSKNGGNMAAKNSGGGTHDENGWYTITLDATDTNTVGRLQVSCKVANALAVFMEFQVLEEAIYDALIGSSAAGFDSNQRVNVGQWLGTAVTLSSTSAKPEVDVASVHDDATAASNLEADYDGTGYNKSASTIGTCTNNSDMRGTDSAYTGTPPTAASIADAVWDEAQAGHVSAGSFGEMASEVALILADTDELQSDDVPGLIASLDAVVDAVGVSVVANGTAISGLNDLDAAGVRTAVGLAAANLDTQLGTLATSSALATADSNVDAIKAKTDRLTFTVAAQVDVNMQSINDVALTGDGVSPKFGV